MLDMVVVDVTAASALTEKVDRRMSLEKDMVMMGKVRRLQETRLMW